MNSASVDFAAAKKRGTPIVMLTAYDFPMASIADQANVDIVLVGDSVGTNVLGYESVTSVTMDDMLHHVRAVRRGVKRALLCADMPFHSCDTVERAVANARLLITAGADAVKIEGESAFASAVSAVVKAGIPVCAHIGYLPQTMENHVAVQGKDAARARELLDAAKALEAAGAFMMVLELVAEPLAEKISRALTIPTIGIGSGRFCDGQVQVFHDIVGLSPRVFKHTKAYAQTRTEYFKVIEAYAHEVREEVSGEVIIRKENKKNFGGTPRSVNIKFGRETAMWFPLISVLDILILSYTLRTFLPMLYAP